MYFLVPGHTGKGLGRMMRRVDAVSARTRILAGISSLNAGSIAKKHFVEDGMPERNWP